MLFVFITILGFRSFLHWKKFNERNIGNEQSTLENSQYEINQIGYHEINNIHDGDSIVVKFNQQQLRLFIFISGSFQYELKNLYIDGIDSLLNLKNQDEKFGFAIDADKEAKLEFGTYESDNSNKKHHKPNHIRNKAQLMLSKVHNYHHNDIINNYDQDFNFIENIDTSLHVVLWLLPRDMCGKSSLFEFGGMTANLTIESTDSIIRSKTIDEITYSNCIFSPLFNIFYSKFDYDINIKFDPSYKSTAVVYSNNISYPDFSMNDENHIISKPYFIKYDITKPNQNGNFTSSSPIKTFITRKMIRNDSSEFQFDIICIAGSVDFCDSSKCFHDYDIESKMMLKCDNSLFLKIIGILAGFGVVIIIAIIVISCLCCAGCCACCGCLCCYLYKKKSNNHSTRNNGGNFDSNPIPPISPISNNRSENDLELPLMSINQTQNPQQFHNPTPMPQMHPTVYYLQPGQINNAIPQNVVYVNPQQPQVQPNSNN